MLYNLNSPVSINADNELKILVAGYYNVHFNFRFRNNQGGNGDRASIQNFLQINGSLGVDRLATSYMRFQDTRECACTNSGTFTVYFGVNDLVRFGFMKIGASFGNVQLLQNNSTITFQRIA